MHAKQVALTGKGKALVFIISLALAVIGAALGALPYGYVIQSFLALAYGDAAIALAWGLYVLVCLLVFLVIWRLIYMAVCRFPGVR